MEYKIITEETAAKMVVKNRNETENLLRDYSAKWQTSPYRFKEICSSVANLKAAIEVYDFLNGRMVGGLEDSSKKKSILNLIKKVIEGR